MSQGANPSATVYKRVDGLAFARLGAELLALDADREFVYCLNETAGEIWDLLSQPTTVEAIVLELSRRFDLDHATSTREVGELVERLREAGIVEIASGQASSRA